MAESTIREKNREHRRLFGAMLVWKGRHRAPGSPMKVGVRLYSSETSVGFLNRWPRVRVTPGALKQDNDLAQVVPGIKPYDSGSLTGNFLRHLALGGFLVWR